jgi:hypothetical protein
MFRATFIASIIFGHSIAFAQNANYTCSWLVFSDVTKATAVERQCRAVARIVGFGSGPKANEWFSQCSVIVNSAIAPCADADTACVKEKLRSLDGPICDMTKRLSSK